MNAVAARLVARLLLIQLTVGAVTLAFVMAFAPRLLLLDTQVMLGSLTLAAWIAGAMIVFELVMTFLFTRKLRPALRALAVGSAAVQPADLLELYALPARMTALDVAAGGIITSMSLISGFRPPTNDLYTQIALVFLTMTMVSAAALPLYIMLRVSVARVLELAPPAAAAETRSMM
jgi:hypothetical protein